MFRYTRYAVALGLGALVVILFRPPSAHTDVAVKNELEQRVVKLEKRVAVLEGKKPKSTAAADPLPTELRSVGHFIQTIDDEVIPGAGHAFWPELYRTACKQWVMDNLKGKVATFKVKLWKTRMVGDKIESSYVLREPFKMGHQYIYSFRVAGLSPKSELPKMLKLRMNQDYWVTGKISKFEVLKTAKFRSVVNAKHRKGTLPTTYSITLDEATVKPI